MKLVDAKGVTNLVMVSTEIPSEKWESLSYDLTSIALPATLTDIYVGQDNPEIKNKGTIYVDELEVQGVAVCNVHNLLQI